MPRLWQINSAKKTKNSGSREKDKQSNGAPGGDNISHIEISRRYSWIERLAEQIDNITRSPPRSISI